MDGLSTRRKSSFEQEWEGFEEEWKVEGVPSLKISAPYYACLVEGCSCYEDVDNNYDDSDESYMSDNVFYYDSLEVECSSNEDVDSIKDSSDEDVDSIEDSDVSFMSDNVFDEDWEKNDDFLFEEPNAVSYMSDNVFVEDWEKNEDFVFKKDSTAVDELPVDFYGYYEKMDKANDKEDKEYLSFDRKNVSKEFQLRIERFEQQFQKVMAIRQTLLQQHGKQIMKKRITLFNELFVKTFVRRSLIVEKYAAVILGIYETINRATRERCLDQFYIFVCVYNYF